MRVLKFRAWDNKKPYAPVMLDWDYLQTLSINQWGNLIPMQFTGLLDKHGKEIYEGDKVRILYTDWPSKPQVDPRTIEQYMNDIAVVGEIQFKDCQFGIKLCSDLLDPIFPGQHGFIEVIGNIYEKH